MKRLKFQYSPDSSIWWDFSEQRSWLRTNLEKERTEEVSRRLHAEQVIEPDVPAHRVLRAC